MRFTGTGFSICGPRILPHRWPLGGFAARTTSPLRRFVVGRCVVAPLSRFGAGLAAGMAAALAAAAEMTPALRPVSDSGEFHTLHNQAASPRTAASHDTSDNMSLRRFMLSSAACVGLVQFAIRCPIGARQGRCGAAPDSRRLPALPLPGSRSRLVAPMMNLIQVQRIMHSLRSSLPGRTPRTRTQRAGRLGRGSAASVCAPST